MLGCKTGIEDLGSPVSDNTIQLVITQQEIYEHRGWKVGMTKHVFVTSLFPFMMLLLELIDVYDEIVQQIKADKKLSLHALMSYLCCFL
jgi:hypothetical protein